MKEQMSTVISELSKIENAAVEIIEDTEVRQKKISQTKWTKRQKNSTKHWQWKHRTT